MKTICVLITAVFLLAQGASMALSQSGYDLFQKALVKERAEGNVEEAIQLYQRIVREFAGNRALAAKALVRMGRCYEKLGKAEARKAYQRVLREYADQREQVAVARARLAALRQPPTAADSSAMVARRIWAGRGLPYGTISPDGRYVSDVDWNTGDLVINDPATMKIIRRLTDKGSWVQSKEYAEHSTFSPDGKQIAYAWFNGKFYDLRLIGTDGSGLRVLYRNEDVGYLEPGPWSPDGKYISASLAKADPTNQLVLISVADGSARVLKTVDWRHPHPGPFSPDGRYLAYDFPPQEDSPNRDVFVLAIDGSREIRVTENPFNDRILGWTLDGDSILFTSDRTRNQAIWAIPFSKGKIRAEPQLIKPSIGRNSPGFPGGFTRDGSFYYGVATRLVDAYIGTLDLAANEIAHVRRVSDRFVGSNAWPVWSPDGKFLTYLSEQPVGEGSGPMVVVIRNLETDEERELRPNLRTTSDPHFMRPMLAPDNLSILVAGWDNKGRLGIYRVDARTAEVTRVVQGEPGVYALLPYWSSVGKGMIYLQHDVAKQKTAIVAREVAAGRETRLYEAGPPLVIERFAISHDGRQLAFLLSDKSTRSSTLMVMPIGGSQPRELTRVQEPDLISSHNLAWTADGREVLFRIWTADGRGKKDGLWRIPAAGGEARRLEGALPIPQAAANVPGRGLSMMGLETSPDGHRIGFTAGQSKGEIWVIEKFLHMLKAAK